MDLHTGTPPWPTLHRAEDALVAHALNKDEQCDVLIIGSGISGALAAYHLVEAGLDVVVIDRRPLARGSTPASTALIQYETDLPLVELAQKVGPIEAQAVYRHTRRILDDLAELVDRESIACDLIPRPTLYLASSSDDAAFLREELRARALLDIEVSWVEERELHERYHIARCGALRSERSFELDPWKLTRGLIETSRRRGARYYANTALPEPPSMSRVEPARTNTGHSIRFRHILYASGYETPAQFESLRPLTQLKSTYAVATPPLDQSRFWPDRALLWEYASPYFYARTTADHRIIIGGEDEDFVDPDRRDALIGKKSRRLLEKLEQVIGIAIDEPDHAWAGTFAETADSLPFIGPAPDAPHCLLALGYGGNGFTFSLIAAQILRDHIVGVPNAMAASYGFDRPLARAMLGK